MCKSCTQIYYNENKEGKPLQMKNYNILKKEEIHKQIKNRYHNDPLYRVKKNVRTSVNRSFNRLFEGKYKKSQKTEQILGCTFEEFFVYLESKFEPWMNWNNKGKYNGEFNYGWDIDHIIPLSSAKTENDIYKLNYYKNLQPLCSKVNRDIKFYKLDYEKKPIS
jgi:hypothetical protein